MILITRPENEAIKLHNLLIKNKIQSFFEPLLTFIYLPINIEVLQNNIILVTSKNALNSLKLNIENYSSSQVIGHNSEPIARVNMKQEEVEGPLNFSIIAMSNSIMEHAKELNFSNVVSLNCYNVEEFIEKLPKNLNIDAKITYLSGQYITTDITLQLKKFYPEVNRIIGYKMVAIKQLSAECLKLIETKKITHITIFSKRTAEIFLKLIKQHNLENFASELEYFVLSNKIAMALNCHKVRIIPRQEEIIELMNFASH